MNVDLDGIVERNLYRSCLEEGKREGEWREKETVAFYYSLWSITIWTSSKSDILYLSS